MSTATKIALSLAGLFIGGVTLWFGQHATDQMTGRFWLAMVMAGLAQVPGYLLGFYQINPVNQPRTPDQIVEAVNKMPEPARAAQSVVEKLTS